MNGTYSHRFWFCFAERTKELPFGGCVSQAEMDRLRRWLAQAVEFARTVEEVKWTRPAMDLWESAYSGLTARRQGAFGLATSRAAPHALRMALIYTLFDQRTQIEPDCLQASLALWGYSERSARHIFGDSTGDRDAEKIREHLRDAPEGLTRSEIRRQVFKDHKEASYVASKLALLTQLGLVRSEPVQTAGRPAQRWVAISSAS
jgi:hypothetical protein